MLSETRGCWLQVSSPLRKWAKKRFCRVFAVCAVEMREMRVAVHLQPFLFGAGGEPPLEIAARVQADAAPIGGRQHRRLDILELGGARGVVTVAEAMALGFARRVGAKLGQFFFRQRLGSGDRLAGHFALGTALADAMLHARHLARMPAGEKIAQDAAVPAQLAVIIRRAFPHAQRGKCGGLSAPAFHWFIA